MNTSSGRSSHGGRSHSGRGRSGGNNKRRRYNKKKKPVLNIEDFIAKAKAEAAEAANLPIPEITNTFNDFKVHPRLKERIVAYGFTTPSLIQDQVIPVILEGNDVVGLANTGTGKTAAFLIPLIDKVLRNKNHKVLIMAPTRELAIQINDELRALTTKEMWIFSTVAVGGIHIRPQIARLKRRNHFVVGTPGRIMDLAERGNLDLEGFESVVLDEADQMLDMGFIDDMRTIVNQTAASRQTLFFSATMSPQIESLVGEFLHYPEIISVVTQKTAKNVTQEVVKVTAENKIDTLSLLLSKPDFSKVLVFGDTKRWVNELDEILRERGINSTSIHGDKDHWNRQRALKAFVEGEVSVLVATDVAARGIDVDNVSHVINYDLPRDYDTYVHRIGRTGRGNKKGSAITFVEEAEA